MRAFSIAFYIAVFRRFEIYVAPIDFNGGLIGRIALISSKTLIEARFAVLTGKARYLLVYRIRIIIIQQIRI